MSVPLFANPPYDLTGRVFTLAAFSALWLVSCESAIAPPDQPQEGAIQADITYLNEWPPQSGFVDLRFVAMRFVPQDTADFLQLNLLEFSDRLAYGVESQSVLLTEVPAGSYPFAVVARQRTRDIFSWQALGIYEEDGEVGVFRVNTGQTTTIEITVDFENLPDFP